MSRVRGLNRFSDRLDLPGPLVTLGEGDTPLVPLVRLGAAIGLPRLMGKLEFIAPSGSYKDRIAAVSMSHALARGQRGWIATSSGNAGMALATYGARAGLRGILFTVATIPREKLLPLLALGITVHRVRGVGEGGSKQAEATLFDGVTTAAAHHDLFLGITAHAHNPHGMRGADTIAYELHETAPNARAVYVPTGGGGLAAAIGRGLRDCGDGAAVVVCQPDGCAPIARFLAGAIERPVIDTCRSGISALQLPGPPDGLLAAEAVRRSGGWGSTASDADVRAAQRLLGASEGLFVEGAAATALAAAIRDRRDGRLRAEDRVVLVLTGAGAKDLDGIGGSLTVPDLVAADAVEALVATGPAAATGAARRS